MDGGANAPAPGKHRESQRPAETARGGDARRFEGFSRAALDGSMLAGTVGRHMQLGPGRLQASIDRLRFNRTGLRTTFFSTAVRAVIDTPADIVTLGFAPDAAEPFLIAGERAPAGALSVFAAGEAHDVLYPAGATAITLAMPVALYTELIVAVSSRDALRAPAGSVHGEVRGPLLGRLTDVVTALARRESAAVSEDAQWRANAERALLDAFFDALAASSAASTAPPSGRHRSARAIVREAEARMNADPDATPSISFLCASVGVSRRTLERAFQDMVNMGPAQYLRVRGLNAAREQLLRCRPEPGIITRIAVDNGFWHMGRFSGAYRTLFGERPIDTVARARQGNAAPLQARGRCRT